MNATACDTTAAASLPPRCLFSCSFPWTETSKRHPLIALYMQNVVVAAASSGSDTAAAAAAAPPAGSHAPSSGRHAFLHDFCMCIPYGALVAAGGLLAKLFGWGQPAIVMMAVGVLQLALSSLSLKVWRLNKSAAPFTLLEAGKRGQQICCASLVGVEGLGAWATLATGGSTREFLPLVDGPSHALLAGLVALPTVRGSCWSCSGT